MERISQLNKERVESFTKVAYFIAAAKELNAPLLSLDIALLEVAKRAGQKTIEV